MNKIMIKGRLTKDIELRYSTGDNPIAIARFSVAVNRKNKKDETDFIDCVAFSGTADFLQKYFSKGQEILIAGRLQVNPYKDKDGNKRTSTEIVVEEVDFCGSKKVSDNVPENVPDFDEDLPF